MSAERLREKKLSTGIPTYIHTYHRLQVTKIVKFSLMSEPFAAQTKGHYIEIDWSKSIRIYFVEVHVEALSILVINCISHFITVKFLFFLFTGTYGIVQIICFFFLFSFWQLLLEGGYIDIIIIGIAVSAFITFVFIFVFAKDITQKRLGLSNCLPKKWPRGNRHPHKTPVIMEPKK